MQINNSVSINSNSVFNTIGSIGDIDELIFPDDEPYYISER